MYTLYCTVLHIGVYSIVLDMFALYSIVHKYTVNYATLLYDHFFIGVMINLVGFHH